MCVNHSAGQLKQSARGLLLGNYSKAISLVVFGNLMVTTLSLLFSRSAPLSPITLVIDYLIYFCSTLIANILQVGMYSFYLKLACGRDTHFKDLFEGFFLYPEKTVISQFVILLLSLICLIPGVALTIFSYFINNKNHVFWGILLFLIGLFFFILLQLSFSQSCFILLDFPDSSAIELLKKSAKLMKGHKLRLFILQLSFLPMIFLGFLSFGIGLLFVQPYQSMTFTLFYLDLVKSKKQLGQDQLSAD